LGTVHGPCGRVLRKGVAAEARPLALASWRRDVLGCVAVAARSWAQAIISADELPCEPPRYQQMIDGLAFTADGKVVNLEGGAAALSTLSRPALTADGRVVDLECDGAAFFVHDRSLSEGSLAKVTMKKEARRFRAMRLAHAACEAKARIEDEKVCAIDSAGILHGLLPSSLPKEPGSSTRLKCFHQKKKSRKPSGPVDRSVVLCVGPDCRVCAVVEPGVTPESRLRIQRKRRSGNDRLELQSESSRLSMAADVHGTVFL